MQTPRLAAERVYHLLKLLVRRARSYRAIERFAVRAELRAKRLGNLVDVAPLSARQHVERRAHLYRVADRALERHVHRRDQRRNIAPGTSADVDHGARERLCVVLALHERAPAGLDVEHDVFRPRSELFAHHRRGDQRHAVHCRGHVAQCVKILVRGAKLRRLSRDHYPDVVDDLEKSLFGNVGMYAVDRLQLVERAAGVPQPSSAELGAYLARRRHHRHDDEAGAVADAACGMLVDGGVAVARQVEHIAAVRHRVGQRQRLARVHAAHRDRHQQRGILIVGKGVEAIDPKTDRLVVERVAVPLFGDDVGDLHTHLRRLAALSHSAFTASGSASCPVLPIS